MPAEKDGRCERTTRYGIPRPRYYFRLQRSKGGVLNQLKFLVFFPTVDVLIDYCVPTIRRAVDRVAEMPSGQ